MHAVTSSGESFVLESSHTASAAEPPSLGTSSRLVVSGTQHRSVSSVSSSPAVAVFEMPGDRRNERHAAGRMNESPLARQRLTHRLTPQESVVSTAPAAGIGDVRASRSSFEIGSFAALADADVPPAGSIGNDLGAAGDEAPAASLEESNATGGLNVLAEYSAQRAAELSNREAEPIVEFGCLGAVPENAAAHVNDVSSNRPSSGHEECTSNPGGDGLSSSRHSAYAAPAATPTTPAAVRPRQRPVRQAAINAIGLISTAIATGGTETFTPSRHELTPPSSIASAGSAFSTATRQPRVSSARGRRTSRRSRSVVPSSVRSQQRRGSASPSLGDNSVSAGPQDFTDTGSPNQSIATSVSTRSRTVPRDQNGGFVADGAVSADQTKPPPSCGKRAGKPKGAEDCSSSSSQTAGLSSNVANLKKSSAEESSASQQTQSCCICLEEPDKYDLASISGCDHLFCFGCIEKWADRENTCPLCKVRFEKIVRVNKKRKRQGEGPQTTGKREKSWKKVKNRDQRADVSSATAALRAIIDTADMNQFQMRILFAGMGMSREVLLSTRPLSQAQRARAGANAAAAHESSLSADLDMARLRSSLPENLHPDAESLVRRIASSARSRPADYNSAPNPPTASVPSSFADDEVSQRAFVMHNSALNDHIITHGHSHSRSSPDEVEINLDSENEDFGTFVSAVERFRVFPSALRNSGAASASPIAGRTPDTALEIDDSDGDDDGVEIVRVTGIDGRE